MITLSKVFASTTSMVIAISKRNVRDFISKKRVKAMPPVKVNNNKKLPEKAPKGVQIYMILQVWLQLVLLT